MKKRIIAIFVACAAALCAGTSCTDITEYNNDPNKMTYGTIGPESLLQELIRSSAQVLLARSYTFSGDFIQHSVNAGSALSYNRYYITNSAREGLWNNLYRWATQADHMRTLAVKSENEACEAIALVMESLLLEYLTDIFGDIPCDEAFKTDQGLRTPKFDSQKDVYTQIIANLSYANELLNDRPTLTSPERDLLYGGEMHKWRKFANSLLLRCYMRMSNRNNEFQVSQNIREIYSNPTYYPVFDTVSDSAILFYDDVQPFINTYGNTTNFASAHFASEFMVDLLTTYGDPRISAIYTRNGSLWKGAPSGEEAQETTWAGVASLNRETLGDFSSPFSLMRYDEVQFIFAEAAQKGWIGGDAGTFYTNAVKGSLDYWQLVSGTTFLQSVVDEFMTKVAYDGSLRQLMTQKYIALFGLGFQAWAEYRRTEYPKIPVGSGTLNDHVIPTRYVYPLAVTHSNPDSYAKAVENLRNVYGGKDDMKTPVWWSLQAVNNGIQ